MQVSDPTTNSLRVHWEPAEGDVRHYNILYVPAAGGTESVVGYLVTNHNVLLGPHSPGPHSPDSLFCDRLECQE